jgi:hypothetical protein
MKKKKKQVLKLFSKAFSLINHKFQWGLNKILQVNNKDDI